MFDALPKLVPNEKPTINLPTYRLAIIGEAPGETEEEMGQPFVGQSGKLLQSVMQNHGLMRSACFLGNVCQHRPPGNEISAFKLDGPEIKHGIERLTCDLNEYRPNCILLLGATPIRLAGIHHPITSFRGSIFTCTAPSSPFFGFKCIAALHPAFVLRSWTEFPLFSFDVRRAKEEAASPVLSLPVRRMGVEPSASDAIAWLDAILPGTLLSVDIEGGIKDGVSCVGLSTDPGSAIIIAPRRYSEAESFRVIKCLGRVLADPLIPKCLQNSLYDNFVLTWLWGCPIRNIVHDTMLMGWEIYPELPKGLETLTSIWTREPYYKYQRKVDNDLVHYKYCCTDAAVTLEIAQNIDKELKGPARDHYSFNLSLLAPTMYMEMRGIKYDMAKAKQRLDEIHVKMAERQARLNVAAKRDLNINSPKQMCTFLYNDLRFEPQYKKEHGRKTNRLTTDVEALLNLARSYGHPVIYDILHLRKLDSQREQLELATDPDGRMRCSYNIVGTETGRLTCYESPTGSGTNLTTIMKQNRDLFIADDDHYFFQCDLAGADGWTVAAHCQRLGDSTMMDDYLAGIKPALLIAVMKEKGRDILRMPRNELVDYIQSEKKAGHVPDWLYFACKRVQHGTNYLMKKNTMSTVILKDSWNQEGLLVYVSPNDCQLLQDLYLSRYRGIQLWHAWVERELHQKGTLSCASGHVRQFFGRPRDHETLKEALAHEPQANTTFATNKAIQQLYYDHQNRVQQVDFSNEIVTATSTPRLLIQPLHQVHDAVCGQFHKSQLLWAQSKIRDYFSTPLSIASQSITIPFDGFYGPSWSEKEKEGKI